MASDNSTTKRRRTAADTLHISDLPNGFIVDVSAYLPKPSRAILAVALSTPSSWKNDNDVHQLSPISTAIISAEQWDVLDSEDVDSELANKLTDDDISAVLKSINARDMLKRLKLCGCINITGRGLNPLRGSVVLEQIDLSLVRKHEKPKIKPEPQISQEVVLPILDSIISTNGCSLKHIKFPDKWLSSEEEEEKDEEEEKEEYKGVLPSIATCPSINNLTSPPTPLSRELHFTTSDVIARSRSDHDAQVHDDQRDHGELSIDQFRRRYNDMFARRSSSLCCSHCKTSMRDYECWMTDNLYQLYICYDCLKPFCDGCADEGGDDENEKLTWCSLCAKDYCQECMAMQKCKSCYSEAYCKSCGDMDICDECGDTTCKDCLGTCNGCNRTRCDDCVDVVYCDGKDCNWMYCLDCYNDDEECELKLCVECDKVYCSSCTLSSIKRNRDRACHTCVKRMRREGKM